MALNTYQPPASDDEISANVDGAFILDKVDLPVMGKACFLVWSTSLAPYLPGIPTGRKYKQNSAEMEESHTLGIDGFQRRTDGWRPVRPFSYSNAELTQRQSMKREKMRRRILKHTWTITEAVAVVVAAAEVFDRSGQYSDYSNASESTHPFSSPTLVVLVIDFQPS